MELLWWIFSLKNLGSDESLNWGDFYFVETLFKLKKFDFSLYF